MMILSTELSQIVIAVIEYAAFECQNYYIGRSGHIHIYLRYLILRQNKAHTALEMVLKEFA